MMHRVNISFSVAAVLFAVSLIAYQVFDGNDENASNRDAFEEYAARVGELAAMQAATRERVALLEARLERIEPSGADPRPGREGAESTDDSPAAGGPDENGRLASRLDAIERRLKGLEEDPIERAFSSIRSESADLRTQGIQALKRFAAHDPDARAAIRGLLADTDKTVRWWALDTLADIGDRESIADIGKLLDDREADIRAEAVNSLNRLKAVDAAPEIALLYAGESPKVRAAVTDAIGDLGYEGGAGILIEALEDSSGRVRREAIEGLGALGNTAAIAPLRAMYERNPGAGRVRLAVSLNRIGDSQPYRAELERLSEAALHGETCPARRDAIRTLGYYMRKDAEAVIRQLASDDDELIREGRPAA